MTCTTFPSTGLVPNVTTHIVGNVTYKWTGVVWEAITPPINLDTTYERIFESILSMTESAGLKIGQTVKVVGSGGTSVDYKVSETGSPDGQRVFALSNGLIASQLDMRFGNLILRKPAFNSYTSLVSPFSSGTRLYLEPKNVVTAGVGGVIKLFGDPYSFDTVNYRDCGWYFSANQAADTGYFGNGCFFLNSKVNGMYAGENPDIAVTFQDGLTQAIKFTQITPSRAVTVIGKRNSTTAAARSTIGLEMGQDIGFDNEKKLWWWGTGNFSNYIAFTASNSFNFVSKAQPFLSIGHKDDTTQTKGMIFDGRYVGATMTANTNAPFSVDKVNTVKFTGTVRQSISNFTGGVDDQRLVLIGDGFTTIRNNSNIKLKSGADHILLADTAIQLVHYSGVWYELSSTV